MLYADCMYTNYIRYLKHRHFCLSHSLLDPYVLRHVAMSKKVTLVIMVSRRSQ